jgi:hypothetical protein
MGDARVLRPGRVTRTTPDRQSVSALGVVIYFVVQVRSTTNTSVNQDSPAADGSG